MSPRLGGVTLTDATGTGVTVIVAVPLCPSLVAVIVAVPAPTAVTRPLAFTVATAALLLTHVTKRVTVTVATAGSELVHVTRRSVSGFPAPSRGVAVSCHV